MPCCCPAACRAARQACRFSLPADHRSPHAPAPSQLVATAAPLCSLTVRSVCVKGVHPAAAERVLIAHFGACGYIQRITFLR